MPLQPDWFEVTQPGVGTNRYAYSFNDPVNGMDPGGNATDGDAAHMSDDVYNDDEDKQAGEDLPNYIHRLSAEERTSYGDLVWEDADTGFYARAYRNTQTGEVTIAYRGTQPKSLADWANNGQQGVAGSSPQYRQAIALAQGVAHSGQVRWGNDGFSMVGHSLGGGLAMAAANSFQFGDMRNAQTFNAAGLSVTPGNMGSHIYNWLAGKNGNMVNHVIVPRWGLANGDPLTELNAAIPGMYVPGPSVWHYSSSMNPFSNHQMQMFRGQVDGFD